MRRHLEITLTFFLGFFTGATCFWLPLEVTKRKAYDKGYDAGWAESYERCKSIEDREPFRLNFGIDFLDFE